MSSFLATMLAPLMKKRGPDCVLHGLGQPPAPDSPASSVCTSTVSFASDSSGLEGWELGRQDSESEACKRARHAADRSVAVGESAPDAVQDLGDTWVVSTCHDSFVVVMGFGVLQVWYLRVVSVTRAFGRWPARAALVRAVMTCATSRSNPPRPCRFQSDPSCNVLSNPLCVPVNAVRLQW